MSELGLLRGSVLPMGQVGVGSGVTVRTHISLWEIGCQKLDY